MDEDTQGEKNWRAVGFLHSTLRVTGHLRSQECLKRCIFFLRKYADRD